MAEPHDIPVISTIAVGLSLAFILGMVASKLRLPPIVGYLLAGIIMGPYTPGFVADAHIAEQLAEIGVVLLMFGVGLHFSIHDFMQVRKIAAVGAFLQIALVTAAGVGAGMLWGWPISTGIIFGLALSVASTVVMLRLMEEHHLLPTMTGKIAVGWLIVEDMAMIVALIMIPALAVTTEDGTTTTATSGLGMQIAIAIGKAIVFAVLMAVIGRRVLPKVLTAVSRTGSRELFTLAVFAMAMGIAFGAAILFGVSFALGAFFAGMMIRESDLNHEVAERAMPFQDAFAVLFFVAVGMLFDPKILMDAPMKVAITVFIIVVGKIAVTYVIVRMFGYSRKKATLVGLSLAQIGEFSFILIALGASVGLIGDEARNLILAGAMISIAMNPPLFHLALKYFNAHPDQACEDNDKLAHLEKEEKTALKDLVILVGYGDVGENVSKALDANHTDLVIIDSNRETVEALRQAGYHAIAGDAGHPDTLKEALIEKAEAVIIALPDPFENSRVIEAAQILKPSINIIVRSYNPEETAYFESQNVDLVVTGTDEIARRMVWRINDMRNAKTV